MTSESPQGVATFYSAEEDLTLHRARIQSCMWKTLAGGRYKTDAKEPSKQESTLKRGACESVIKSKNMNAQQMAFM
jgi:hypothetical protein